MAAELQIKGIEKLTKLASKYPAISEKFVNTAISRSLVRVFGEEKREAPFGVTAALRDNWRVDVGRFEGRLTSNTPYAKTVHDGGIPNPFPSGETLKPWALKKGLNPWAVAKAIRKRGHIIANPFLDRAAKNADAGINSEFTDAISKIVEALAS